MVDVEYTIEVPRQALEVLRRVHGPSREECRADDPAFFYKATTFDGVDGYSAAEIKDFVRNDLIGLVGVVLRPDVPLVISEGEDKSVSIVGHNYQACGDHRGGGGVLRGGGIYVPPHIGAAVRGAEQDEDDSNYYNVSLEFDRCALPALQYLVNLTATFFRNGGSNYPQFSMEHLAEELTNGRPGAREFDLVRSLTGVVAEGIHPMGVGGFRKTLFLPPKRIALAELILRVA